MPLVRIDIPEGQPSAFQIALGEAIQQALHDALDVPMEERFQVIAEHPPGALVIDRSYLGVARSHEAVIIQITLNRGRGADEKRHFYATLADVIHDRVGLRREDVVVSLIEVERDDWSFGNGVAQSFDPLR